MHTTTLRNPLSITSMALLTGTLTFGFVNDDAAAPAAAAASVAPVTTITTSATAATSSAPTPQRISGVVADVLVQIRGGSVCSGMPITGTRFVITAAHCVLDRDGNVGNRTVVRDGVEYRSVSVLVDTSYNDNRVAALDGAVLVMSEPIPGPSATLGSAVPATGSVTLAGFQSLDSDGSLLRGSGPHDVPIPQAAQDVDGGVIHLETAPAGCTNDATSVEVTAAWVRVPCGLIPGGSGGGLFATHGDEIELVGIVSTVSADITHNGVVPMASLRELLEHKADYLHFPTQASQPVTTVHVSRS
jgi:Trypsin